MSLPLSRKTASAVGWWATASPFIGFVFTVLWYATVTSPYIDSQTLGNNFPVWWPSSFALDPLECGFFPSWVCLIAGIFTLITGISTRSKRICWQGGLVCLAAPLLALWWMIVTF
jgi:hypothetical protein